jgi:putative DNA primase/helicase
MTGDVEIGGVRIGLENADLFEPRVRIAEAYASGGHRNMKVSNEDLCAAIEGAADAQAYHPVEEWLSTLKWDNNDRLTEDLPRAFGKKAGIEAVFLRRFLRAMVARATTPGCKVDTVLVLVGEQGHLKSTALKALTGDAFFSDQPVDIGNKDSWEMCHRHWLIELGELTALKTARGNEQIKAFISKTDDTFRSPYGRKNATWPRRFVFAGSTNDQQFLTDSTGNRRFWPVWTDAKLLNVEWLRRNREQLLAQAKHEFDAGEAWWLDKREEAKHAEAAEKHVEIDAWEPLIRDQLTENMRRGVSAQRILAEVLNVEEAKWNSGIYRRVCAILRRMGARPMGGRERRGDWHWPDEASKGGA